jgi:hypothetical protein
MWWGVLGTYNFSCCEKKRGGTVFYTAHITQHNWKGTMSNPRRIDLLLTQHDWKQPKKHGTTQHDIKLEDSEK